MDSLGMSRRKYRKHGSKKREVSLRRRAEGVSRRLALSACACLSVSFSLFVLSILPTQAQYFIYYYVENYSKMYKMCTVL